MVEDAHGLGVVAWSLGLVLMSTGGRRPCRTLFCGVMWYYLVGAGLEGEYLRLLVDGRIVTAAYLVRLEEGLVAGWPPEMLGDEVARLVEELSVPMEPGLYFLVGGNRFKHRYVGLVVNRGIILLRLGEGVPGENLARHLSRIFELLSPQGRRVRMKARRAEAIDSPMPGRREPEKRLIRNMDAANSSE